jgi:chromate transporter
MSESPTWILFSRFTGISLLAVGGANAVVPEMHRQLVQLHPLLSERDFGALVGLAQAAPGPNVMVVGLLGFRVAGILGACCATAGMSLPPAVLSVALSRLWRGGAGAGRWQQPLADALLPLTVGLVLASSYTLVRGSGCRDCCSRWPWVVSPRWARCHRCCCSRERRCSRRPSGAEGQPSKTRTKVRGACFLRTQRVAASMKEMLTARLGDAVWLSPERCQRWL